MSYREPMLLVINTKTGLVARYTARKRGEQTWVVEPAEAGGLRELGSIRSELEVIRIFGRTPEQQTS